MIFETIASTAIIEGVRHLIKRKPRNNPEVIQSMNLPTFETVGELRKLLSNFADDVPTYGNTFRYPHIQVRSDLGRLYFGSSSHPSENKK